MQTVYSQGDNQVKEAITLNKQFPLVKSECKTVYLYVAHGWALI